MIIGDAHDQPALTLHQVLHCQRHFLVSSCPALCRASTSSVPSWIKTWMAGTSPAMTVELHVQATKTHASNRLSTSVALVPPKPKEFESTVPSLALSMRLRTIGISANNGSSSVMWALSQINPLFIINSE